ncbi:CHY zinc finger protein [Aerococcus sanguinicola]|uniref:CHY zinc finger protein n=1 Tax=unclassified Aerococcus TaxID=2618060 RepID=UPI0008A3FE05|nr:MULTISPECIES: CHY zinc finger protein [unclassified Aerococcus]KAB0645190.1 hypothetical protein F6I01_12170 [Aerococcus sanguinicola]MDK6233907.1 CHY zinc finger protein [Aerococcus sp. UMB10185]MDK6856376.1 CHY zinc finger protein [Aerococcus sp. UMB7533]MDK8502653.1 CHY zinc finger protein [Aerococcus sp. UMB1112A]OFN03839.1 hypothetical protein HMPREF2626_05310 [Aerococcus sp. HMSC062A02]
MEERSQIRGLGLDGQGRCQHYHLPEDILALYCSTCRAYYACYRCHDALANHAFTPIRSDQADSLLCGACRATFDQATYEALGRCSHCRAAFNPACQRHAGLYFASKKEKNHNGGVRFNER